MSTHDEQGRLIVSPRQYLQIGECHYRFRSGRIFAIIVPHGIGELTASTTDEQLLLVAELLNAKASDNGYALIGGVQSITAYLHTVQHRIGLHYSKVFASTGNEAQ